MNTKQNKAPSASHILEIKTDDLNTEIIKFPVIKVDNIEAPIPIDTPEENLLKFLKGSEINIKKQGINALKKINSAKLEFPNITFPQEQILQEVNCKNTFSEEFKKGIKNSPQAPIKIPSTNEVEPTNLFI